VNAAYSDTKEQFDQLHTSHCTIYMKKLMEDYPSKSCNIN